MSNMKYFLAHPCGDKSKVTAIDLASCVSYERNEWDCIDDTDFKSHRSAIKHARIFANYHGLQYIPFDSRYDESLNEKQNNG